MAQFPYVNKNRLYALKNPLSGLIGVNVTSTEQNTKYNELADGQNVFTDMTGAPYARSGSVTLGGAYSQFGSQGGWVFRDNEDRYVIVGVSGGIIYYFDGVKMTPVSGAPTLSTTLKVNGVFYPDVDKFYLTNGTDSPVELDQSTGTLTATSKAAMQKSLYLGYHDHHLYFLNLPNAPQQFKVSDLGAITANSASITNTQGYILGMASLDVYNSVLVTDQKAYRLQGTTSTYDASGNLVYAPGSFMEIGRSRCVASRSILYINNAVYWVGLDEFNIAEIYRTDGQQIFPVGWIKLKTYLRNLSAANLDLACAVQYGMYAKFAVPSMGSSVNDTELILDTARSISYTESGSYGPPQIVWEPRHFPGYGVSQYASFRTSGQDYILGFDDSVGIVHRTGTGNADDLPLFNSFTNAVPTSTTTLLTNNRQSDSTATYQSTTGPFQQRFVATTGGTLQKLSFWGAAGYSTEVDNAPITTFSHGETVTIALYSDSAGSIGSLLDSTTISSFDISWTTIQKHTITMTGAYAMVLGTAYWVKVSINTGAYTPPTGSIDVLRVTGISSASSTLGWRGNIGFGDQALNGTMGYEVYQSVLSSSISITSTTPVTQPYYFGQDTTLTSFSLIIRSNSTTNVATLTVYTDSNGSPGVAVVGIPTPTLSLVSTSVGVYSFVFNDQTILTGGAIYHFVVSISTGTLGISADTNLSLPLPYRQLSGSSWNAAAVSLASLATSLNSIDAWFTHTSALENPLALKRITRMVVNATSTLGVTIQVGVGTEGSYGAFSEIPLSVTSGLSMWGSAGGTLNSTTLIWTSSSDSVSNNNSWSFSAPDIQETLFMAWFATPTRFITIRFRAVSQSDWRINSYQPIPVAIPTTLG